MRNDIERTLSIIKPDGVKDKLVGKVLARFEENGLIIRAMKMLQLSKAQAQAFYAVHSEKWFYERLTNFMCSGPIVVLVLEGEDIIQKNRQLMGDTDPAKAGPGTLRGDMATDIDMNLVHGSDSPETADLEIAFFFPELELLTD